jgi:hypothetical protein
MAENNFKKIWRNAIFLSKNTSATRNRFVDFLRILSITFVIIGHWLLVTAVFRDSGFWGTDLLSVRPDTHWLTWILQIMPVFFIVGGYANSVSWKAHSKNGGKYKDWFILRLRRLVWPTFPLILIWVLFTIITQAFGVAPDLIKVGALIALQPVWFLVVYLVIVIFTPLVLKAWEKLGIWSFWILSLAAVIIDILRYGYGFDNLGWVNYLLIWLAVHQLGIAWQDGWFKDQGRRGFMAITGFLVLAALVSFGSYPFSMVNIPGEKIGNLFPPNIAMLALAGFQGGTLLLLENMVNVWLSKEKPWAVIVLLSGVTMTMYLWHVTVNALVIGAAYLLGGVGLKMEIGGLTWWLAKLIWIPLLFIVLFAFVLIFGKFERLKNLNDKTPVTLIGVIIRTGLAVVGLGMVALAGISGDGIFGLNTWALVICGISYLLLNFSLNKKAI